MFRTCVLLLIGALHPLWAHGEAGTVISTQDTFPKGLGFVGIDRAHVMQPLQPYSTETNLLRYHWYSIVAQTAPKQVRRVSGQALPFSPCEFGLCTRVLWVSIFTSMKQVSGTCSLWSPFISLGYCDHQREHSVQECFVGWFKCVIVYDRLNHETFKFSHWVMVLLREGSKAVRLKCQLSL